eukprot:192245-Amphidinium_carterae.1
MMTEATAYEWLVPGHPGTPTAGSKPAEVAPDALDVPMVPEVEDPYFDEDEQEIERLQQALIEKKTALAAKRRKLESTRSL